MTTTIGERLKTALNLLNMSQIEFANNMKVVRQTVNNWCANDNIPPKDVLVYLHGKGIDLMWLLIGIGVPYNDTDTGKKLASRHDYDTGEDEILIVAEATTVYVPNLESMTLKQIREYYSKVKEILPRLERIVGGDEDSAEPERAKQSGGMEEQW